MNFVIPDFSDEDIENAMASSRRYHKQEFVKKYVLNAIPHNHLTKGE